MGLARAEGRRHTAEHLGRPVGQRRRASRSGEFSPDGSRLVVLRSRFLDRGGPTVSACDTASWTKLWRLDTTVFYPKNLAFGPDGTQVAIAGEVRNIRSWPGRTTLPTFGDPPLPNTGLIAFLDMDTQAFVRTIAIPETSYASRQTVTWQAQRNALTYGAEHALRTVDASSGAPLGVTATENLYGRPAAFLSPDGRGQIETGFGPKERLIRVVDVAGGARKVLLEKPAQTRAVAWSRDSRYFALGAAAFSLGAVSPLRRLRHRAPRRRRSRRRDHALDLQVVRHNLARVSHRRAALSPFRPLVARRDRRRGRDRDVRCDARSGNRLTDPPSPTPFPYNAPPPRRSA